MFQREQGCRLCLSVPEQLREKGLLTAEEFVQARAVLIGQYDPPISALSPESPRYCLTFQAFQVSNTVKRRLDTMAKSITRINAKKPGLLQRKRVAAYARVSMDTERLMHSLSVQVSCCSELIRNTPGVYADEGITGTKMDSRPAFIRMLAEIVRRICTEFLQGATPHTGWPDGIRSPGGQERWNPKAVQSILTNER
ncbi:MAG: recombinase family protein [Aristaeellaceae bacterium]